MINWNHPIMLCQVWFYLNILEIIRNIGNSVAIALILHISINMTDSNVFCVWVYYDGVDAPKQNTQQTHTGLVLYFYSTVLLSIEI